MPCTERSHRCSDRFAEEVLQSRERQSNLVRDPFRGDVLVERRRDKRHRLLDSRGACVGDHVNPNSLSQLRPCLGVKPSRKGAHMEQRCLLIDHGGWRNNGIDRHHRQACAACIHGPSDSGWHHNNSSGNVTFIKGKRHVGVEARADDGNHRRVSWHLVDMANEQNPAPVNDQNGCASGVAHSQIVASLDRFGGIDPIYNLEMTIVTGLDHVNIRTDRLAETGRSR